MRAPLAIPVSVPLSVNVAADTTVLSKVGVPAKLTLLPKLWLAPTMSLLPDATLSVPTPTGPLTTPKTPATDVELPLNSKLPAFRLKLPAKVLWPLSCRMPLPVLVTEVAAPAPAMTEVMFNVGESVPYTLEPTATAPTSIVFPPLVKTRVPPDTVAATMALREVAVIGDELVRVRMPVGVIVGPAPSPPTLLSTKLARVLLPARVSAPRPLIVTMLVLAIEPAVVWETATAAFWIPPLMMRPPAGMTTSPAVVGLMLTVP